MYRVIVRELRHSGTGQWTKMSPTLIPDPIAEEHFGTGRMLMRSPTLQDRVEMWQEKMALEPDLCEAWADKLTEVKDQEDPVVTYRDLVGLTRSHFKNVDAGMAVMERSSRVLQWLPTFYRMVTSSHVGVSKEGVRIEITTTNSSNTDDSSWFIYRVRASNVGKNPRAVYRLVGRHWIFRNGKGDIEASVPRFAEGVVGLYPELLHMSHDSGQVFEYVSGAELTSKSGTMEGSFLFEDVESGKTFEVVIPEVPLMSSLPPPVFDEEVVHSDDKIYA